MIGLFFIVGWLPLRFLCVGVYFDNICIGFMSCFLLRTSHSRFSFKLFTANVIYSLRLADSDIICIISGNLC